MSQQVEDWAEKKNLSTLKLPDCTSSSQKHRLLCEIEYNNIGENYQTASSINLHECIDVLQILHLIISDQRGDVTVT